jgi:hypothetical protein
MRHVATLILSILLTAACGFALCAAVGWNPRPAGMVLAGAAALVAGIAAFLPLILSRGATQAAVAQAALLGTVIHLMGCLAGAVVLLMVIHVQSALYWILAFYWATLIALVFGFTRAVKTAPPAPAAAPER